MDEIHAMTDEIHAMTDCQFAAMERIMNICLLFNQSDGTGTPFQNKRQHFKPVWIPHSYRRDQD
jgi:hypothetical protein